MHMSLHAYMHVHTRCIIHTCLLHDRGYGNHVDANRNHLEPESDSDGDGGHRSKLRGTGQIEFSPKGIPHGILHFPRQLKSAGHIYMHDTCAPEAAHAHCIKRAMDRVRKGTAEDTSAWMIDWVWRVRAWAGIIQDVFRDVDTTRPRRTQRPDRGLEVFVSDRNLIVNLSNSITVI